jgi:hypothetical protein
MLEVVRDVDRLTDAQRQFASVQRARPVLRSSRDSRMIFMYRTDELGTSRWLVDHAGRVVESAVFRRSVVLDGDEDVGWL